MQNQLKCIMRVKIIFLIGLFLLFSKGLFSQVVTGVITSEDKVIPFANIIVKGLGAGTSSNKNGEYKIENVKRGYQHIIVSAIGMVEKKVDVQIQDGVNIIDIQLKPSVYNLDQIVVTGTKTFKRRTESAVIVNVIDSRQLENVQACNLAEGLVFQSGLRVETDCQTCNYTQLRMNGLAGGYSQILINGKSIFSPLTGLYGMEQIPKNMIDRVEVIKGGGSSLYGSSAIGGVVNIITKIPVNNSYNFGYDFSKINTVADDKVIYGNATVLSEDRKSGATFFVNNRNRMWYDHNGDNFSELPLLKDNTFGVSVFLLPLENHKLEANIGSLYEYRYGGEMIDSPPHFAMQSEERLHNVLLANMDYKISFNQGNSSFTSYLAAQKTDRKHYTGIRPSVGTDDDINHLMNPPYGSSLNVTKQGGFQLDHNLSMFSKSNTLTIGLDYTSDYVIDEIPSYAYFINQKVQVLGSFFQSDWAFTRNLNLLSGFRLDKHSLLEDAVVSPRFSLLYKLKRQTQLRFSYSTGFRAPQAFDADLHIAFSGGGVSRILLADDLKEERSQSVSASINYDKATDRYVYGFTFEGFYTVLKDAFYQDYNGSDDFGEIFVKRNGSNARVKGLNLELRANLNQKFQLESGATFQQSLYDKAVMYSEFLSSRKEFLRTPNYYSYATFSYMSSSKFAFFANLVHTGAMELLHLAGAPGQLSDEFVTSPVFNVIGLKATYTYDLERVGAKIEYSLGVKNLTNDYQQEFDSFKNRDSNFIYGPNLPRTIYFEIVLKSI